MPLIKEKYSLKDHNDRFDTEQKCHDYLVMVRWQGIPQCPECANTAMNYYISTRNIYKCSACYKQFSITQGTIFHRSKIPLTKWFLAIYLFTTKKRGVSSVQMAKWLGVKQQTAWFVMHRLREALKNENEVLLKGIVEADECFIGPKINRDLRLRIAKAKHDKEQNKLHGYSDEVRLRLGDKQKRGRKQGSTKEVLQQKAIERGGVPYTSNTPSNRIPFEKGAVILGMTEQKGKLVMKKLGINNRSINRDNIFPHLKKHISSDSIFVTDQLNLYDTTSDFFAQHLTVHHGRTYVVNGIHINNVENAWKHLQKMIDGTYFHISHYHFDRYLDENTYRWNRRNESEKVLFESFLPLVAGRVISYQKLITKDHKQAA